MFMHLLIYGFGPYLGFHDNVTEKIVRKLRKRRWFQKVIFPVRFYRSQFINVIKAYDPDVILGLGQCSSGRLLRVEPAVLDRSLEKSRFWLLHSITAPAREGRKVHLLYNDPRHA